MAISYVTSEAKRHWLADVAEAAGIGDLKLPQRASFALVRAAWAEIARTSHISEVELAERVAAHFRLTVADLSSAEPQTSKLLPEKLARRHGILPLRASDNAIVVATADPVSMEAEQDIQFLSGRQPVFQVAAPGPLLAAIDKAYSRGKMLDFVLQTLAAESSADDVQLAPGAERERSAATPSAKPSPGAPTQQGERAQSIADLVKRMLRRAVIVGATEVRVDPQRDAGQVRFRVDGVLEHFMHLPRPALVRVVRRIKEIARLDPDCRRTAQDGQFKANVGGRAYRLRVESAPSGSLERITLSISCPTMSADLDALELGAATRALLTDVLQADSGVVVVASPRRSSRERLVHASLKFIRESGQRVSSIETQLAYDLEGIEQTKADAMRGFPVASAIAQMMEDLPGTLALEALDDPAAASLAFDAAQRGALVILQSDAEDFGGALASLTELGISRDRLADAVRTVIVSRSLRRLCGCAKPTNASEDLPSAERALADAYEVAPPRVAHGCGSCRTTGFRGEIAILEIAQIDEPVADGIRNGASLSTLTASTHNQSDPGMRATALGKASAGDTTLQEVERVLGPWSEDEDSDPGPPSVLVVDDTASDRLLMRTLLEQKGFRVVEASGGPQALRVLEASQSVSLVLLDLLMPGMSGQETLAQIRASVATAGLPVIILTASEDPSMEVALLAAGADDYLGKPFEPSRLAVRVRAVLRRAGAYDPDPM